MKENDSVELKFPLECHFRVIAEDLDNMGFVIETVLMQLGVFNKVEKVNSSASGKYVSFNITTTVESRDRMTRIDSELRMIRGVKMVL